jgi:hypothetical protein
VIEEVMKGDVDAAQRRLHVIDGLSLLEIDEETIRLTDTAVQIIFTTKPQGHKEDKKNDNRHQSHVFSSFFAALRLCVSKCCQEYAHSRRKSEQGLFFVTQVLRWLYSGEIQVKRIILDKSD